MKEIATKPKFVTWTISVSLATALLLALPVLPVTETNLSGVHAAEKAEALDINTATAE